MPGSCEVSDATVASYAWSRAVFPLAEQPAGCAAYSAVSFSSYPISCAHKTLHNHYMNIGYVLPDIKGIATLVPDTQRKTNIR